MYGTCLFKAEVNSKASSKQKDLLNFIKMENLKANKEKNGMPTTTI